MANRASRIVVPIYAPSFDGRYWGRYPNGDRPNAGVDLAADAAARAAGAAALGTGIRMGGAAADAAAAAAGLSSGIRLGAGAADVASASGNMGLTADQEWAAHSVAAGVIAAWGLNSASDMTWYHAGANGTRGFLDTTSQKLFGGGSLRFDLRAHETSADIAGNWCKDTGNYTMLGNGFGQNSTFWVRWFMKLSSTMYDNLGSWKAGVQQTDWKIMTIFRGGESTCANMDVTVKGTQGDHIYTDCGNRGGRSHVDSPLEEQVATNPHLFQMGWSDPSQTSGTYTKEALALPDRAYPAYPDDLPTDQWFAVMLKIHIGTWGSVNTTIEEWIKKVGDAGWRKKVSVRTLLNNNNSSSNQFTNVQLTPYMTGLSTSASQDAFMYFNGLLIGTQQLPEPTVFA